MIGGFLKSVFAVVQGRLRLIAVLNVLFFGCVLVASLVANFVLVSSDALLAIQSNPLNILHGNWLLTFLYIFGFNLCLSAFVFVTLPGIVFFPLSVALLSVRAALWGFLVYLLPLGSFFVILPTLLLEGEGYVFAAAAGIVAGGSWLKPKWFGYVNAGSRGDDLKRGARECGRFYVLVIMLLLLAAVVETVTVVLMA